MELMKAVFFEKPGGLGVLKYGKLPKPRPKKGEALIRVRACALNHLDLWLRKRKSVQPIPHIAGSDVSGTIEEIRGKSKLKAGDEVVINPSIPCGKCERCKKKLPCEKVTILGSITQGGYAEYVTAPLAQVYPKPKSLSFAEAAAFPLDFLTAWHMLVGRARLRKGETVFVWGASGGLGSAGVQIARHLGARVIAATRLQKNVPRIKRLGADHVVVYSEQDVEKEVERLTGGNGVDVAFESVGKKTWKTSLAILKFWGRVVIAGTTSGAIASQDLSEVYYRQQSILGARMGTKEEFEKVLGLAKGGKLKPVIDKIYPLREAAVAQKRLEEGKQFGKIVLEV